MDPDEPFHLDLQCLQNQLLLYFALKGLISTLQPHYNSSLVVRKPVLGASDQVRHRPGCASTENGYVAYTGTGHEMTRLPIFRYTDIYYWSLAQRLAHASSAHALLSFSAPHVLSQQQ